MAQERYIGCDDPDILEAKLVWHGPDTVFINQTETDTSAKHCIMFNAKAARQVRDALNEFLSEQR